MLKYLSIYSILFLATVHASGKFSVLNAPSSLEFKGDEKLSANMVGDVLSAALGYFINTDAKWSGLYIKDPFSCPKNGIAVLIDGIDEIHLNDIKIKTYPLTGNNYGDSFTMLSSMVENDKSNVVELDLNDGPESMKRYPNLLSDIKISTINKSSGSNLKPDLHPEDKLFLQQIGILNSLSDLLKSKSSINLLIIKLSLKPLQRTHGENSAAITEAVKLLSDSLEKLALSSESVHNDDIIFVVASIKDDMVSKRIKRQAAETNLNLSPHYDEDYPVIFNIILWFMVAFVFALIAIAYAIADMDPGRDSIIYRMTSTRMKKEN